MFAENCQLTAITEIGELQQLCDLYRCDWPTHCVGYYCLKNFIRWLQLHQREIQNLQIFTLDHDWRSDGLYLIVDRYQLFVNSLLGEECNERLTKAISLLDWTSGYKVSSFLERHRSSVLHVVRQKQLTLEYDNLTVMYYMPQAAAIKLPINCPKGYALRPLDVAADAEIIDTLWPNRHQGSLFLIKRLVAWNANMGVYGTDTNQLVAWCLRLQGGFLGALQVRDSHKRLGLGSLVAAATARRIAEQGDDVMALVNKTNLASRGMLSKLGFGVINTCYWLRNFPQRAGLDWPEDNLRDLKTLRDLYRSDDPAKVIGYNTLDNYIRWFEQEPHLRHIKILTLPDIWRHNGLYLVLNRCRLMVNTAVVTSETTELLCYALKQIEWTPGYIIVSIPDALFAAIKDTLESLQLDYNMILLDVLRMPRTKALTLDASCPPEYKMRPLTAADSSTVYDSWDSHHTGALAYIQQLIRFNCNVGICTQNNNELVAWCIRCPCGFLGMLHVKEAFRRRGLAKLAIAALAHQVADFGEDVYTTIGRMSTESLALFNKLNFEPVALTHIIWARRHAGAKMWSEEQEQCEH